MKTNLLLCFTGSVATIKARPLLDLLLNDFNVEIIATEKSLKFLSLEDIDYLKSKVKVYIDSDEWDNKVDLSKRSALHIDLRNWANAMLIAPCSANTLAKLANGMADNLLTSVCRAWDYKTKFLIIAPAMNTLMWENPFTSKHMDALKSLSNTNVKFIPPISKTLFCGDIGVGAMEQVSEIAKITKQFLVTL
ncbi:phosphopantothenoylcysteine decarboxylase [Tieghemostelium lacteum]|uniref:Phosphopantothenoylcysteine decarboxylase n=1 Tax=Tieghemostelium lacteum TaxID=361077 RepID=A0A151Z690_TIELA|nr:phosphopantothenoylcysteine decarboxylase [Tieghemostelium lacteum]|eukprot:KYQ89481.1 phosphopantothenoylcysteine decarboxylase [Tieghemostelium lacteum]